MRRSTFCALVALAWSPLACCAAPGKPTLFLIGDSTVKNGTKGQEGWGTPLAGLFDAEKITVKNAALGGRSSRTFLTEGLWEKVLAEVKAGDFAIVQFGHNDGGGLRQSPKRASIKGTGEETETVNDGKTGTEETVHTYGWYLRRYIADAKAKGATVIVCSPVPRNIWKDGRVGRSSDYGGWAKVSAEAGGALFIDLNALIADRYDAMGEAAVKEKFFTAADHTHTLPAGAALNAECVVEGLKKLPGNPLAGYIAGAR